MAFFGVGYKPKGVPGGICCSTCLRRLLGSPRQRHRALCLSRPVVVMPSPLPLPRPWASSLLALPVVPKGVLREVHTLCPLPAGLQGCLQALYTPGPLLSLSCCCRRLCNAWQGGSLAGHEHRVLLVVLVPCQHLLIVPWMPSAPASTQSSTLLF